MEVGIPSHRSEQIQNLILQLENMKVMKVCKYLKLFLMNSETEVVKYFNR